ncbi:hypothetical protein [Oceanisphaera sp. IT1-181]|uniref:hypothetical protein n=1 Tax=Oceanisphaera sp. IT1-181 TaxID=3081199 RepID=UPI0029CA1DFB|nr:hypothetical protein [Oceanisphaera sp. IT1-181]
MSTNTKHDIKIAEEIKHLSLDEIEELYIRYLNGEKNSLLTHDYKIDINPNKLLYVLPPRVKFDKNCPYCDITMFKKRQSKSATNFNLPPAQCYECNHKEYLKNKGYRTQTCDCESCLKIERDQASAKEVETRNKIVIQHSTNNHQPVSYCDLKFNHKLTLLTLFLIKTNESFDFIVSLDDISKSGLFTPTKKMDIDLIMELYSLKIIIIDPNSKVDAFIESEEGGLDSFYISKIQWIPNVFLGREERLELSEIYNKLYDELKDGVQSYWESEVHSLLFTIAREEVLQYIYVKADELNVEFSAELKTREIVNQLLNIFSVAEVYYFAHKAVESAHLFYHKGFAKSKKHAANTIPNKMLSLAERAVSERWVKNEFSRDSRAPRSHISKILYDFLLKDENAGFSKAPGKYWEEELYPMFFSGASPQASSLCCSRCGTTSVVIKMVLDTL